MEQITSDRELIDGARKMDPGILTQIYQSFSPGIFRYALRLLGSDDLAEDCVADTFSRFLKALNLGQGPADHLEAYLYRIAHNWITDYYRRQSPLSAELNEVIPAAEHLQPEQQLTRRLEEQKVRLALRALTPEQRQVVMLRVYEEWSYEEISAALGKPQGTIRALLFRALQSLRRVIMPGKNEVEDGSTE